MQFQVPQFIEVEDKIFGPLTFRQFVFVLGGFGMCYLLWRILPVLLAAPLIIIIAGFAAALAFMQYNGRPFIIALENAFYYILHPKLYLWSNEHRKKGAASTKETAATPEVYIPHLSDSKLHDLAWSLDIQERIATGVAGEEERLLGHGHGDATDLRGARGMLHNLDQTIR
jgi:hypothetical protein